VIKVTIMRMESEHGDNHGHKHGEGGHEND